MTLIVVNLLLISIFQIILKHLGKSVGASIVCLSDLLAYAVVTRSKTLTWVLLARPPHSAFRVCHPLGTWDGCDGPVRLWCLLKIWSVKPRPGLGAFTHRMESLCRPLCRLYGSILALSASPRNYRDLFCSR